jgi:Pectate lyase superfamily protein
MKCQQSIFLPLIFVLLIPFSASAQQPWSGILDPTRAIDWTSVGVPGGIPNRTTICATVNASTFANGGSDATAGIQSALNSCGSGQVVLLSAGTFLINSGVHVPSNVTLRGSGTLSTILQAHGTGSVISLGPGGTPSVSGAPSITGGATQGSTSIVLSSASGVSVGSYLLIAELNASWVSINGSEGACTWCDGGTGWNGTRVRGQIVEVTSVSGNTVGITPLYSAYTLSPLAVPFNAAAKYAGVEDLQVYANNTGYGQTFLMDETAYCWIKGVFSNYADGNHVSADYSYRGEIRDSYFSNAFSHTPGTTDGDVFIANKTSGFLVENNILERLHVSIMLNWGAAGNVVAYNYATGNFDISATNVNMMHMSMHGAHPQFNLWEGNVAPKFQPDSIWGSSSHNTSFRNWATGTSMIATPYSGRGVIDWADAHPAFQASRAMDINFLDSSWNFVGDVVGSTAMAALSQSAGDAAMPQVAQIIAPANRSYDSASYDFDFGYGEASDTGTSGFDCGSPCIPFSTALIHGEYTGANGSITWSGTLTHSLPPSFVHSSKPSWFGNSPWPPIGPDVSGGIDGGGHASAIPALACYNSTPKDSNGLLMFDSTVCYGGSVVTGTPPAAPTNLGAVVN